MDAYASVIDLLEKYRAAIMCGDYVTWKYEDPESYMWEELSLIQNHKMECLFKVTTVFLHFNCLNFNCLEQLGLTDLTQGCGNGSWKQKRWKWHIFKEAKVGSGKRVLL